MRRCIFLVALLLLAVWAKDYFINHPTKNVFFLSFTDITKLAALVERKPVPLPYLESYVEYPVVIGFFIYLLGRLTADRVAYFWLTGLVLSVLAGLIFYLSDRLSQNSAGRRKLLLFWLFSPTVFLFTVYNWDVLAAFFLVLALYFYAKNRDLTATFFLALGVWTKLFPVFLLPAIIFRRVWEKRLDAAFKIAAVFVALTIAINLPLAWLSFRGWSAFFEFSQSRGPNIDSLWAGLFVVSDKIFGRDFLGKGFYTSFINFFSNASLLLLLGLFYLRAWRKKCPDAVLLTLSGILLFLLTAKVYSPPYNYWVLPLLALSAVRFRDFLLFDVSNLLVFWAVFEYFYEVNILGHHLLGFPWYKLTYFLVLLRHLFLLHLVYRVWRLIDGERQKD